MKEDQFFEAFSQIDSQYIEDAKLPLAKKRRAWAWKKLITVVAVLLLVIIATITLPRYENEHYYITMKNGEFYLKLKEPHYEDKHNMCGYVYHVSFASVQEMYDDFTTGNFTKTELEHMQAMEAEKEEKLGIPNLNRLCEPILPEDVSWDGGVTWYGSHHYSFKISQKTFYNVTFSVTTKEFFEQKIAILTDREITYPIKDIAVEQIEDRNATIYNIEKYSGFKESYWVYDLSSGDKQIIVQESFPRTDYYTNHSLRMFINDGDYYGFVYIICKDTRPSVEWLSSFGLKEIE